jgi:hypothetical protein
MVALSRVRPEEERANPDATRSFGCLVVDINVLKLILGVPLTG